MFRRFINRQSADQAVGQEVVRLGSVALVVTTMFLGVSHAGERADYIPACPRSSLRLGMPVIQHIPLKCRRCQKNRVC